MGLQLQTSDTFLTYQATIGSAHDGKLLLSGVRFLG